MEKITFCLNSREYFINVIHTLGGNIFTVFLPTSDLYPSYKYPKILRNTNKRTMISDSAHVTWCGKSWRCLSLQLLLSRVTGNLMALNHINLLPVWGQMSNVNWNGSKCRQDCAHNCTPWTEKALSGTSPFPASRVCLQLGVSTVRTKAWERSTWLNHCTDFPASVFCLKGAGIPWGPLMNTANYSISNSAD